MLDLSGVGGPTLFLLVPINNVYLFFFAKQCIFYKVLKYKITKQCDYIVPKQFRTQYCMYLATQTVSKSIPTSQSNMANGLRRSMPIFTRFVGFISIVKNFVNLSVG